MVSRVLPDRNALVRDLAWPIPAHLREVETVSQAIARLRQDCAGRHPVYFYVTDEEGRLIGVVPSRRLLLSEPATLVGELMVHPVHSVAESATFGSALAVLAEHRLLALPVVDEAGRLTGTLNIAGMTRAVVDLEQQQASNVTFQLTGLRATATRTVQGLLVSLAAGLSCAFLLKLFAAALQDAIAIAFFVPLVMSIGERIAFQAASPSLLGGFRANWRKLPGGAPAAWSAEVMLAATSLLLIAAGLAMGWVPLTKIAGTAALSILAASGAGLAVGYTIPRLMCRWHLETRVASAPVVSAMADIAALSCYLALCGVFVR